MVDAVDGDVYSGGIAPVAVEEHYFFEAVTEERLGYFKQHLLQGVGAEGQGAGEAHMMLAVADPKRRCHYHLGLLSYQQGDLQRMQDVGAQRELGSVLLNAAHGDNRHVAPLEELLHLSPAHVGEIVLALWLCFLYDGVSANSPISLNTLTTLKGL